jgi:hypothetical protein
LQIGLIGKDGWVIASDRTQVDQDYLRASNDTIKLFANEHMACAASGDGLALMATAELLDSVFQTDDLQRLRAELAAFGNAMWDKYHATPGQPFPDEFKRALLIGFSRLPNRLWILNIGKGTSHATPRVGRSLAGDSGNAAVFFSQRYYSSDATLEQLTFLAAHLVTIGSELNTAGVGGGLDVALCENGQIRTLGQSETDELIKRSAKVDKQIAALFR